MGHHVSSLATEATSLRQVDGVRKLLAPGVLVLSGILLGRAAILASLAPFHLALCAAIAVRLPHLFGWLALPALIMRTWTAGLGALAVDVPIILLLVLYIYRVRPRWAAAGYDEEQVVRHTGLVGGAAVLLGAGVAALWREGSLFALIELSLQALLVALLGAMFARALAPLHRLGTAGFDLLFDDGSDRLRDYDFSRDEWLSLAVLIAVVLGGFHGIQLGVFQPGLFFTALLVMAMAKWGGVGGGAAAGTAIAAVGVIYGLADPITIAIYALAGLLAGLLFEYGAFGAAAGYVFAFMILSAFYRHPAEVAAHLWSVVPAAALFVLLHALGEAGRRFQRPAPFPRGFVYDIAPRGMRWRWRWRPQPSEPPPQQRDEQGRRILRQFVGVAREMAQAFEQVAANEEQFNRKTVSGVLSRTALDVCHGCLHYRRCWDREVVNTYHGLAETMLQRETLGEIDEAHLPADLRRRCPRTASLVAALNHGYEMYALSRRWWRRVHRTRQTVAAQLRAVGDVLDELATRPLPVTGHGAAGMPALPYRIGVAKVPKRQKVVSGDSTLHRQLGPDRLALVLSDGMGAGMHAAAESRTTIGLLEKLLDCGFDETTAVRTVNQIMLLRDADEMFATLDLALIGLQTGEARFVKIGAAPSFIRRRRRVGIIRAAGLPMGVVSDPELTVVERSLQRGDLIVMLTDGVLQAWDRLEDAEAWIQGFLSSLNRDEPRYVASELLREAMRRSPDGVRDDMTVLVLKLL